MQTLTFWTSTGDGDPAQFQQPPKQGTETLQSTIIGFYHLKHPAWLVTVKPNTTTNTIVSLVRNARRTVATRTARHMSLELVIEMMAIHWNMTPSHKAGKLHHVLRSTMHICVHEEPMTSNNHSEFGHKYHEQRRHHSSKRELDPCSNEWIVKTMKTKNPCYV